MNGDINFYKNEKLFMSSFNGQRRAQKEEIHLTTDFAFQIDHALSS